MHMCTWARVLIYGDEYLIRGSASDVDPQVLAPIKDTMNFCRSLACDMEITMLEYWNQGCASLEVADGGPKVPDASSALACDQPRDRRSRSSQNPTPITLYTECGRHGASTRGGCRPTHKLERTSHDKEREKAEEPSRSSPHSDSKIEFGDPYRQLQQSQPHRHSLDSMIATAGRIVTKHSGFTISWLYAMPLFAGLSRNCLQAAAGTLARRVDVSSQLSLETDLQAVQNHAIRSHKFEDLTLTEYGRADDALLRHSFQPTEEWCCFPLIC
ncbi:hypothetical protein BCR34DRAFT_582642 [Clohesyomyces aquaticus]|uniref:Uncharacterized protein n=1 Tax=Clohesyomyces aquaticus TaxID=1231657 RepID=A0A1Y2A843_9PLEO|nr:hypothetical protein BCR34DRAFT_582642 [Clohesyomyces aquaticus]